MPLFGPPDVDKLRAKGDVAGLAQALRFVKDWGVIKAAALALIEIGDPQATKVLAAALVDRWSAEVRSGTARALGEIGGARSVELLAAALKERSDSVGWYAEALAKIGDARAVEPLIAMLPDKSAATALGQIRDPRAVEPLVAVLAGAETANDFRSASAALGAIEGRRSAATALGQIGDQRAVDALVAALGDRDGTVRVAAAEALRQFDDARAKQAVPRVGAASSGPQGDLERSIPAHAGGVHALTVTPDGLRIVSGGSDQKVRVWDLASGEPVCVLEGHKDPVLGVAVTPDNTRIVSVGDSQRFVRVWDLATGRAEKPLSDGVILLVNLLGSGIDGLWSVAVSPDGVRVIAGGRNTLMVWRLADGHCESTGPSLVSWKGDELPSSLAFAPDSSRLVSAGSDKKVRIWDLARFQVDRKLEGHAKKVKAVAVTPDGARLVSGGDDHTVRIWDFASGQLERTLEGHTSDVYAVAVTPDGSRIVSGGKDGTVRVWDLASGRLELTFGGDMSSAARGTNWVNAVAVTPDGARVISGQLDGTVRVWTL